MKIVIEDNEDGTVNIGDRLIDGHVDDLPCESCGEPRVYFDDYDSYFCAGCNKWLEGACNDSVCGYCKDRPEFPLEIRESMA